MLIFDDMWIILGNYFYSSVYCGLTFLQLLGLEFFIFGYTKAIIEKNYVQTDTAVK